MKKLILLAIPVMLLFACGQTEKKTDKNAVAPSVNTEELKAVDVAFSKMSTDKGYTEAFNTYAADDAMMFTEGNPPMKGKDSIVASFTRQQKQIKSLLWEPQKVDVSSSNDLGYTTGDWKVTLLGKDGQQKEIEGFYSCIWKKQADGAWKFEVFTSTTNRRNEMQKQNNPQQNPQQQFNPQPQPQPKPQKKQK